MTSFFIPLKNNRIYVIGVSGGPDSMFLLDKMRILNYKIVIAHIDYKKRGNSWFDKRIVEDYCKVYNLDFFSIDVVYSKFNYNNNFQALARNIRYDYFSNICSKFCSQNLIKPAIVIAHNLEDLIETYYIQKKRNSLVNFWGLPFISNWKSGFEIYRPILKVTKAEILEYLKENKISYAVDYTNYQEIYQRNVVRKSVFILTLKEKEDIVKIVNFENFKLSKILRKFNFYLKNIIIEKKIILNSYWHEVNEELKKRILFHWLNVNTEGRFLSRKKNIFSELIRQFKSNNSKKIVISFNCGFRIEKFNNEVQINVH
ncbi:MAG TPA: tRNA lysidine(34) synthetase TilS [Mycoplasmatales bacterium]|jgi:tRNA(Ile)-lysidine synthase|nr:tRNA lysidine(34) synthetase TilS [Mycoplasmatales bacterium]